MGSNLIKLDTGSEGEGEALTVPKTAENDTKVTSKKSHKPQSKKSIRDSMALTSSHGSVHDPKEQSINSSFKPTSKPATKAESMNRESTAKPESQKREPTGEVAQAFSIQQKMIQGSIARLADQLSKASASVQGSRAPEQMSETEKQAEKAEIESIKSKIA